MLGVEGLQIDVFGLWPMFEVQGLEFRVKGAGGRVQS